MITVLELHNWLAKLDPSDEVGIDEGGLTLMTADGQYVEVGGLPADDEEADE